MGAQFSVCLYLNLFNDFFQLDEKEEEEEAGYSGSNGDGWKEVFKRLDRQTDIIAEEEKEEGEDASTFSVDLEKPRQKRRKRKERRNQLKDPNFWPGLSEQVRAEPNVWTGVFSCLAGYNFFSQNAILKIESATLYIINVLFWNFQ
jgi:hypothetical protein